MTLLLKLLVPVATFLVALIPLAVQEKWLKLHDGRTKGHGWAVRILIALMLTLTAITCAIVYVDEKHAARLTSEVQSKTSQMLQLAQTNVTLGANIVSLSQENMSLVKSQHDLITGGHMYCTFVLFNRTNEVFELDLSIQGSHALGPTPVLRNVTVYITRSSNSATQRAIDTPYRIRSWTRANGRWATDELFFSALHADNTGFIQGWLDLSGFSYEECLVEFFSANGSWVQWLQFAKVDGKWTYAVTTMPRRSSKHFIIPHQRVVGAFPTNRLAEKKQTY